MGASPKCFERNEGVLLWVAKILHIERERERERERELFQWFQKKKKTSKSDQSFTKEMMVNISPLQFFRRIVGVYQTGVFECF